MLSIREAFSLVASCRPFMTPFLPNPHAHRRRPELHQGPRKAYGAAPFSFSHTGPAERGHQTARAGRYVAGIGRQLRPQHFHHAPSHARRMSSLPQRPPPGGFFSRVSTRSLRRSTLALSIAATPATTPIIGTTGRTPASSTTLLMITATIPAKAFSVTPSHCIGAASPARLKIALTRFCVAAWQVERHPRRYSSGAPVPANQTPAPAMFHLWRAQRAFHEVLWGLSAMPARRLESVAGFDPTEPFRLASGNDRLGAGRAVPSAKAEWPRRVESRYWVADFSLLGRTRSLIRAAAV